MVKQRILAALMAASLMLTTASAAQADELTDLTPAGMTLGTGDHGAYISGENGRFRPQGNITRAEVASILYRLLPKQVEGYATYLDVPAGSWYELAAGTLGYLGVLRPGEMLFQPSDEITRGEFIRAVACFFPACATAEQFTDVSPMDPNASYYLTARSWGWLNGFDDGSLRPEQKLTRAETVSMLNRALSRTPDKAYIDRISPLIYLDISADSWYYYDVMEAAIPHVHTFDTGAERWTSHTPVSIQLEPGFHLVDNWLYYFSAERHDFVRSGSVGNFSFDAAGHFTSGSTDLDARLRKIVASKTDGSMTQEEKLRALYVYTRDSFTYLRRPAYQFGATDFMQKDALDMLVNGYGNCYSYASLFWYLSRWIGYDAKIYSGTVGSNKRPHSWVEINFDGKDYIFDTELEMAYHKKGRYEINLYKYIDVDNWQYIKP